MSLKAPILITGCARSGTSVTAGIFFLCGAFGGKMSGPTRYNKKGMFENAEIRNQVVKPYLKETLKVDPMGQDPLPDIAKLVPTPNLQGVIEGKMKWQGYRDGPWFYKGAKMCLIWPIWHTAFPKARWVIVRRRDEDIIHSCMKTGFMRAFKTNEGWQGWIDAHKQRFEEMKNAGLDMQEVWPEKFINDQDYTEVRQVVKNLGLRWRETKVKELVSEELWKGTED